MKAEELMIGDWVKPFGSKGGIYAKVTTLDCNGRFGLITNGGNPHHGTEDTVEPIPLTTEILEKNGFKRVDKGDEICIIGEYVWLDKGKRNLTVARITYYEGLSSGVNLLIKIETDCSHESGINMVHSCDIEYVHQLQHALKLCGIDKEITL